MVETSRLESGHTRKGIGGSNPSLSAISFIILFAGSKVGLQPDLLFQLWSPMKSSDHSPQVFAFRSI